MKLETYLRKQSFLYLFGIFLLALGIKMIIDTKLGAGPWDLLSVGLSEKTLLSVGVWQVINNVVMIVLTKVIFKKKWNFICLVPGILQGLCIDLISLVISFEAYNPYVMLSIGCALSGLGLAIYMNQGLSPNAIDNFFYQLRHDKKIPYGIAKLICDAIPVIVILLLQINLQYITMVVYFMVPIFVQCFYNLLQVGIFKQMKIVES